MQFVNEIIVFIQKLFGWWFVVMPWEQAIHVKRGKNPVMKGKGLYFKVPFIDAVYIQTCRTRMVDAPAQTISTTDGKAITVKSAISYSIGDMFKLYNTMSHPENTLIGMVMSAVAEHIRSCNSKDLTPKETEDFVVKKINAEQYGLQNVIIRITSWAEVRTIRLIQDSGSMYTEQLNMDHIDVKKQ